MKKNRVNKVSPILFIIMGIIFLRCKETRHSQELIHSKQLDDWYVYSCQKLQNMNGVASKELVKELKDYQAMLDRFQKEKLEINSNMVVVSQKFQEQLRWPDTIYLDKKIDYRQVKDDELTSNYPGDELIDTVAKTIGASFLKLLGYDGNTLNVLWGNGQNQAFALCLISENEIGLFAMDQNILVILRK